MKMLRAFQYALLALVLGPLVGVTVYGAGKAIAQAVNSTGLSTTSTGAVKVTVNTPPNDVVAGPTSFNSPGNLPVSAQGAGSTGVDIRGTFTGLTALFEGSVDGTNYISIPCVVPSTGAIVTSATAAGVWTCQSAGYQNVRVRITAISTGSAVLTLNASAGSNQPPIGIQGTSTNITAVGGNAVTTAVPVTGTFTASGNQTVVQPTAANLNATVVGTGTFATQSVVTNAGTFATQTTGAVNVTLTDCSGTIATGNTAQNAFSANAGRHGFTIANIDTTEVMWISFTGTAAASGTASYPLAPATATTFAGLNSFTSPLGMGINTALSVIAATTAHKFSCTVW